MEGDSIEVCVDVANSDQISGTGSVQLATQGRRGNKMACYLDGEVN